MFINEAIKILLAKQFSQLFAEWIEKNWFSRFSSRENKQEFLCEEEI
jgi:hypothetical protein